MRADESGITVHDLWERIRRRVADALGQLGIDEAVEPVQPPSPEFGHLGFPVFKFARVLRRAPDVIARQVAERIETDDLVSKVVTLKGFVNFFLNEETLGKVLLREILEKGDGFAAGGFREDFRSLVEYSAPNTNKPLHLGHIRNNLLGLAVCRTLSYYGHDVVRVNLINDRGVHICKTMLAYQRWGEGKTPEGTGRKGDHMVGDLYVRFDREFKKEYDGWKERTGGDLDEDEFFNTASELGGEVRRLLTAWEAGDEEVLGLWRRMNDWVLEGFDRTYSRMGCEFDVVQYESETYKLGKSLVHQGLESGIFTRRDDGAVVLDLAGVGIEPLLDGDGPLVVRLDVALERGEVAVAHPQAGGLHLVVQRRRAHVKNLARDRDALVVVAVGQDDADLVERAAPSPRRVDDDLRPGPVGDLVEPLDEMLQPGAVAVVDDPVEVEEDDEQGGLHAASRASKVRSPSM